MQETDRATGRPVAIVPATLRDIAYVTANLRPQDRHEIRASADLASTVEADARIS